MTVNRPVSVVRPNRSSKRKYVSIQYSTASLQRNTFPSPQPSPSTNQSPISDDGQRRRSDISGEEFDVRISATHEQRISRSSAAPDLRLQGSSLDPSRRRHQPPASAPSNQLQQHPSSTESSIHPLRGQLLTNALPVVVCCVRSLGQDH